jgi:hypothetical protein
MEIQPDAGALSAGGSAMIEISSALAAPAIHCESALESAAVGAHDRALSSVLVEICGLATQAHRRLGGLVAGVGIRTVHAATNYEASNYEASEGLLARSAGKG